MNLDKNWFKLDMLQSIWLLMLSFFFFVLQIQVDLQWNWAIMFVCLYAGYHLAVNIAEKYFPINQNNLSIE